MFTIEREALGPARSRVGRLVWVIRDAEGRFVEDFPTRACAERWCEVTEGET